jgi:hypothetical protein
MTISMSEAMTAQGNVPDYQTPRIGGVRAERFRGSEHS